MSDWLQPTFLLALFAAWMFLALGIPWALVLLPRVLRANRVGVVATGMALGPIILTTIMFGLGWFGTINPVMLLAISGAVAALGAVLAWWRTQTIVREQMAQPLAIERGDPITMVDLALIVTIGVMVLIDVLTGAYWPFLDAETQRTTAYHAKMIALTDDLPPEVDEGPLLVPLSYAYMMQVRNRIDDHVARVVLPWFNVTMILMAYMLGRRVFDSQRAGLLTAALWSFSPQVAAWSEIGDQEIVLTLYVTGAVMFFIKGWRTERWRNAMLSGLMLGGALWTKPTAVAFLPGMALALIIWAAWVRLRPAELWPKLRLALLTLIFAAPVGSMWYLYAASEGYEVVTLPGSELTDMAQRSGQELGWPLVLAFFVAGGLIIRPPARWREGRARVIGVLVPLLAVALLLAGILPSALDLDRLTDTDAVWSWLRGDLPAAGSLSLPGVVLIGAGAALLLWIGRDAWAQWDRDMRQRVMLLWVFIVPYGAVWFWLYSYHYRLSFLLLPLFAAQIAALIDNWVWDVVENRRFWETVSMAAVAAIFLVGAVAGVERTFNALIDGALTKDTDKYRTVAPALVQVRSTLLEWQEREGRAPVVSIPGEDRLPFFLPRWDIRHTAADDLPPTTLDDLRGIDVFVGGTMYQEVLDEAGLERVPLQAEAALGIAYEQLEVTTPGGTIWPTALEPLPLGASGGLFAIDGAVRYEAFDTYLEPRPVEFDPELDIWLDEMVIVDEFARLSGYALSTLSWTYGDTVQLWLVWEPTIPAPVGTAYEVFVHLNDSDGNRIAEWAQVPLQGTYPTWAWEPGAVLLDYWELTVPAELPPGPAQLRVGLQDPAQDLLLGMTVDDRVSGGFFTLTTGITIIDPDAPPAGDDADAE